MTTYDVVMIAFVDIFTDARILNISKTLAKNGLSVVIFGLGENNSVDKDKDFNITYYQISVNKFDRAWQRWIDFYRKATIELYEIETSCVFAEDIYSLAIAKEIIKRTKARFIYDSREIYSAIASLSQSKKKQFFISFVEKKYIKKVDKIIVTGERDELYLKKNLTNKVPYYLIKNLPIYKDRIQSNLIREKFNIPDDNIVVLYQGMLLKGRGLEKIINTVSKSDAIVFVIIGAGPLLATLRDEIEKKQLGNKVFLTGAIPYASLHKWTCSADIGLSFIEPISKSYELALPNKLFEYIMARIPVLCSELPAMKEIIDTFKIGKYLEPDCENIEIIQTIQWLNLNKEELISNCNETAHQIAFENQESIIMSLVE